MCVCVWGKERVITHKEGNKCYKNTLNAPGSQGRSLTGRDTLTSVGCDDDWSRNSADAIADSKGEGI